MNSDNNTIVYVGVPLRNIHSMVPVGSEVDLESSHHGHQHQGEQPQEDNSVQTHCRYCNYVSRIFAGLMVGAIIQMNNVYANIYLTQMVHDHTLSTNQAAMLSSCWSLAMSLLALLLWPSNKSTQANSTKVSSDDTSGTTKEQIGVESCFILGALFGGFLVWVVVDLTLGYRTEALYSLFILLGCLLSLRAMVYFIPTKPKNDDICTTKNTQCESVKARSEPLLLVV